jgi:mannan endo-1,4-beta-mannosidase
MEIANKSIDSYVSNRAASRPGLKRRSCRTFDTGDMGAKMRHAFTALPKVVVAAILLILCSRAQAGEKSEIAVTLVDPKATRETRSLFLNLSRVAKTRILFGHQNSTLYGVGWKADADPIRSDVKTACGKLPAVYGWDLNAMGKIKSDKGQDLLQVRIREAHKRGAINTISWHMRNPVTGETFYDTTRAVGAIVPGGSHHAQYKQELDKVAVFIGSLKDENGRPIPIIFRPFHEHTGNWFWWGKGNCTAEEYSRLWRFTVTYLRDRKELHNLLYAYSPAKCRKGTEKEYLWGYPGDRYVDILGYDHYCHDVTEALPGLRLAVRLARQRGKLSAFTETGVPKGMSQAKPGNYYTDRLLSPLSRDASARQIAYILLWQNRHAEHFWVPYQKGKLMQDFKSFAADPLMGFEDDLDGIYSPPKE